jgi:hypothetical protein
VGNGKEIHTAYNTPSPNATDSEYKPPSPSAQRRKSNSRPRKTQHTNISSSSHISLQPPDPVHGTSISCSTSAEEVNRRHPVGHPSNSAKADGSVLYPDSVASLMACLNPPLPDYSTLPKRRRQPNRCFLHLGLGQSVHHVQAAQRGWINVRVAVIAVARGYLGYLFFRRRTSRLKKRRWVGEMRWAVSEFSVELGDCRTFTRDGLAVLVADSEQRVVGWVTLIWCGIRVSYSCFPP